MPPPDTCNSTIQIGNRLNLHEVYTHHREEFETKQRVNLDKIGMEVKNDFRKVIKDIT